MQHCEIMPEVLLQDALEHVELALGTGHLVLIAYKHGIRRGLSQLRTRFIEAESTVA